MDDELPANLLNAKCTITASEYERLSNLITCLVDIRDSMADGRRTRKHGLYDLSTDAVRLTEFAAYMELKG